MEQYIKLFTPVSERLPEDGKDKLCLIAGKLPIMATYIVNDGYIRHDFSDFEDDISDRYNHFRKNDIFTLTPRAMSEFIEFKRECFKLLLCPLSDITKIEALDCYNFSFPGHEIDDDKKIEHILNAFDPYIEEWAGGSLQGNSLVFIWALRKGFDLFGLIESGLALDKTKTT